MKKLSIIIFILYSVTIVFAQDIKQESINSNNQPKKSLISRDLSYLYSWDLYLIQLGVYNHRRKDFLLTLGLYNDYTHDRAYDSFIYIPTLLQFGVVNTGDNTLIRGGIVNYGTDYYMPGIDIGVVNHSVHTWQLGVIGLYSDDGFQQNLINLGGNCSQLGGINIHNKSNTSEKAQLGIINISLTDNSGDWQWGIINIARDSEVQIGIININTFYTNTSIGLINVIPEFPYIVPLLSL